MSNEQHWAELHESEKKSSNMLLSLLDEVCDLQSFVRFIKALGEDWEDAQRKEAIKPAGLASSWNGWENGSIGSFLEAAVAWTESNQRADEGFLQNENPWKAAAKIIYSGKYYE